MLSKAKTMGSRLILTWVHSCVNILESRLGCQYLYRWCRGFVRTCTVSLHDIVCTSFTLQWVSSQKEGGVYPRANVGKKTKVFFMLCLHFLWTIFLAQGTMAFPTVTLTFPRYVKYHHILTEYVGLTCWKKTSYWICKWYMYRPI